MEVSTIEPPSKWDAIDIAQGHRDDCAEALKLEGELRLERGALVVLKHLSPRRMIRAVEQAVAGAAVAERS